MGVDAWQHSVAPETCLSGPSLIAHVVIALKMRRKTQYRPLREIVSPLATRFQYNLSSLIRQNQLPFKPVF